MWPGFGDNVRVLEWILERVDNKDVAKDTSIGYIPKEGTLNTDGLGDVNMKELFEIKPDFWKQECDDVEKYFKEQVNKDLPAEMWEELDGLRKRTASMQ